MGPAQLYDEYKPTLKDKGLPTHGVLLPACGVGFAFTPTIIEDVFVQLLISVTVTIYVPASVNAAVDVTVGF